MNFKLKSLLSLPVLFLGLIFMPLQEFGLFNDLKEEGSEVEIEAFNPPRDWETEIVDSESGAGASIALDKSGKPGISYIGDIDSSVMPPVAQLKYAKHTGTMWQPDDILQVAASNTDNSLQIDSNGNPHISYYSHFGNALAYIFLENGMWINDTVDDDAQKGTGIYNSLQLTPQGLPRIAYWDAVNGMMMYASSNGTVWSTPEKIFEMTCIEPFPPIVSLALDSNNRPHVSFYDCEASNLKYAYRDSSGWQDPITVDATFRSGLFSSIVIDSKDNPHISYRSGQLLAGRLMYTFFNGSKWNFIQVDPDFWYGEHSSLALDEDDRPHIAYTSLPGKDVPTHELRVAFYDGLGWFRETVDKATDDADYTAISLKVDQNGHTHVAYIDSGSDQLKYAHRDIYRRYVYMPAIIKRD
jgi:hypothetical protein